MRDTIRWGRFMYWAPWGVTDPWKPRWWKGCDEYHNLAVSVILPFAGAFHWFYGPFEDQKLDPHLYGYDPEEGFLGREVSGCKICISIKNDE